MTALIAIDCDNTLICYDALFKRLAREHGLVSEDVLENKVAVRDAVRATHGDMAWRKLQVRAYGSDIDGAILFPGALETLCFWRQNGLRLAIVSHKTQYSNIVEERPSGVLCDLRQAALEFLRRAGVLDCIPAWDVYFTASRREKVQMISSLGCAAFVDDLPEVFLEPDFPAGVTRLFFAPAGAGSTDGATICRTWRDIRLAVSVGNAR